MVYILGIMASLAEHFADKFYPPTTAPDGI